MRFDARAWMDRFIRFWRGSLQLRTIIITVVLSGIAVTIIGVYISTSVRTNLFDSRTDQIVAESSRATLSGPGGLRHLGRALDRPGPRGRAGVGEHGDRTLVDRIARGR